MNTIRETMEIEGMTCGHCVAAVSRAIGSVDGVVADEVAVGSACILYDPTSTPRSAVVEAIEDAGFAVKR